MRGIGAGELRKGRWEAGVETIGHEEGERKGSPQRRPGCKGILERTHISKRDFYIVFLWSVQ